MKTHNLENSLFVLMILIIVLIIQTVLIMVIWNNVIIKKFPSSNIQKLGFFDALAISVFCALLTGRTYIIRD